MRALLIMAGLIVSLAAQAALDDFVKITVPAGFDGPTLVPGGASGHVRAYVRKAGGDSGDSVLQISTYDFGSSLNTLPAAALGPASEKYLLEFLGGVERRRTAFQASKPTRLQLGGVPASRVEWNGQANGRRLSGVMYCVIVGSSVVSFHIQGFTDDSAAVLGDAMRAIESVSFAER